MIEKPHLLEDGTHLMPIQAIRCVGCELFPKAVGTVKWNLEEGVSFVLDFPGLNPSSLGKFYQTPPNSSGAGSLITCPSTPRWIGETAEGLTVGLYGLDEILHRTISSEGTRFQVKGKAWFATATLPKESPLGFWNDTPACPRLFFVGFTSNFWPKSDEVTYSNGIWSTETSRRSFALRDSPEIQIYEAASRRVYPDAAWLTYQVAEGNDVVTSNPCALECGFLSMLNGGRTSFFWKDVFTDSSTLQRVYFGLNRESCDSKNRISPLLPLQHSTGAANVAKEVVEELPKLFASYLEANKAINLPFILSPLWSASEGFLTDKVALACVGLERLATAWKQFQNTRDELVEEKKFWTPSQSRNVRRALKTALKSVAAGEKLTHGKIGVIESRIDQLGQMPNADKLIAVFDGLGLKLSDFEMETVAHRNKALHGRGTLDHSSTTREFDDEVLRFDTLRMLITKAVLALLRYRGPFINYAARTPQNNFPTDRLRLESDEWLPPKS